MKIYYFNDTKHNQFVSLNDFHQPFKVLQKGSGEFFEIELKEGESPFIKVWENGQVLISTIKENK